MAIEGLNFKVGLDASGFNSGINSMQSKINSFASGMQKVGGVIAGALAGGMVVNAVGTSINEFKGYQKELANVYTMIDASPQEFGKIEESLISTAETFGKSREDVLKGFYDFVSATGGEGTVEQYNNIVKAATAGNATIVDTTSAAIAIQKSFGYSLDDLMYIMDRSQQTVQDGKTNLTEYGGAMLSLAPLASAMGLELNEVNGIMSTFSGQTGTTSAVATQFESVLSGLIKPTTDMSVALMNMVDPLVKQGKITSPLLTDYANLSNRLGTATKKYNDMNSIVTKLNDKKESGVKLTAEETKTLKSSNDMMKLAKEEMKGYSEQLETVASGLTAATIETMGFDYVINNLLEQTGGNMTILGDLFGRKEAITLLTAWAEKQETVLENTQKQVEAEGAVNDAFEKHAESVYFQYERLDSAYESLRVSFGELMANIGAPIATALTVSTIDFAAGLRQATDDFNAWYAELQSKETFDKKLEFTLNGIATFAGSVVDAAGDAIHNVGEYMRVNVLGLPSDPNASIMEDIYATVKASVTVIQGTLTWFGGKIDEKADLTRAELGLAGDNNSELDIGDISIIASATFTKFSNAASDIFSTVKTQAIALWTGEYPEGVNIGEQKIKFQGIADVSGLVVDASEIIAGATLAVKATQAITTALTGASVTIPNLIVGIGMISLAWDFGTLIGNAIVESFNKNNQFEKTNEFMEEQLRGTMFGAFDGMLDSVKAGPEGEGAGPAIKYLMERTFLVAASEMEAGANKLGDLMKEYLWDKPTQFLQKGTDNIQQQMQQTTQPAAQAIASNIQTIFDALKPPDVAEGGIFADTIKSFDEFYAMLFSFGDKSQEALAAYNEGIKEYNKTIEGTDLPKLPELKIEPPSLADNFDAEVTAITQKVTGAIDTITSPTEKKYTITFGDPDTTNVINAVNNLSPQTVSVKLEISEPLDPEPIKSAINNIFSGAQSKLNELKGKITESLNQGAEESTGIENQIADYKQRIEALGKDLGRQDIIGKQARENIDALTAKIESLQQQQITIDVKTEGLSKANFLISAASFGLGLLNQGAQITIDAVTDPANQKIAALRIELSKGIDANLNPVWGPVPEVGSSDATLNPVWGPVDPLDKQFVKLEGEWIGNLEPPVLTTPVELSAEFSDVTPPTVNEPVELKGQIMQYQAAPGLVPDPVHLEGDFTEIQSKLMQTSFSASVGLKPMEGELQAMINAYTAEENMKKINFEFTPVGQENVTNAIDSIPKEKTITINFEAGSVPDYINFDTLGPQFQPTPGGGTIAPGTEVPINLPNEINIPAAQNNTTVIINADRFVGSEEEKQETAEYIAQYLVEAGRLTP